MKWIQIFETGKHTDSAGRTRKWSESDLEKIVDNFDAETSAPAVIGHPSTDSPAWGWVDKLKVEAGKLFAAFRDLVPEFEEAVLKKMYPNRSVSLRPVASGGHQLRHVGFLGAAAPAVQGMERILGFEARDDDLVIEFSLDRFEGNVLRRFFRGMRDLMIDNFGIDAAERAIPGGLIEELEGEDPPQDTPGFSENNNGEIEMNHEQVKEMVDNAVGEAKDELTKEFGEKEKGYQTEIDELKRNDSRRDMAGFIDEQVRLGNLPPKFKQMGITEFMLQLDGAEEVQFAEGDEGKQTPLAWFRQFVTRLGDSRLFSTMGAGEDDPGPQDENKREELISEYIAAEKEKGNEVKYAAGVKEMAAKHPEVFTV